MLESLQPIPDGRLQSKIDSENGTTVKGKKGWDILHYLLCLARMTVFNEHECVCTIPEDYSGIQSLDGLSWMASRGWSKSVGRTLDSSASRPCW